LAILAELALKKPDLFIENCFEVSDKQTGLSVPFTLKATQRRIYEAIQDLRAKYDGVCRLALLKARREGASSLCTALGLTEAMFRPGYQFRIVADDEDGYSNLFNMVQNFHASFTEKFPVAKAVGFRTKQDSIGRWVFDHKGGVRVATVNAPNAVRSSAGHFLHLSEVAHFPEEMCHRLLLAAKPIVPMAPNTYIIAESTANGTDNYFHRLWQEACRNEEDEAAGKTVYSHWRPLFIPWFEEPTYQIAGVPLTDDLPLHPDKLDDFLEEEKELRGRYSLTDEQLVYRRFTIFGEYGGDVNAFRQEYPATADEAFVASGGKIFDRVALVRMLEDARSNPGQYCEISYPPKGGKLRSVPADNGRYEIHEPPQKRHAYLIAADPSEGKADHCGAIVYGIIGDERVEVATYSRQVDEYTFANDLATLGEYYNWAYIAPERSRGAGRALVRALVNEVSYPYLWTGMDHSRYSKPLTDQIGVPVHSEATKSAVISELAAEIIAGHVRFRSLRTITQLLDYAEVRGRLTNATKAGHDDLVMAAGIGAVAWNTQAPASGALGLSGYAADDVGLPHMDLGYGNYLETL